MSSVHQKASTPIKVNVDNFIPLETANQFARYLNLAGQQVNVWYHFRRPVDISKQPTIRMNQDTLYSSNLVDIRQEATLTMPQTGGLYQSVMVINEEGYINRVYDQPGTYRLTVHEFQTPFVLLGARTFLRSTDLSEIEKTHSLQDGLTVQSSSSQPFLTQRYDEQSYRKTFDLLVELARGLEGHEGMAGSKQEVNPVHFLLANAFAWGGLPERYVYYENVEPHLPATRVYELTAKEVPVDHFWSVTIYNQAGFLQDNDQGRQSFNNFTAQSNRDGSITLRFGNDPSLPNMLPIMEGWNYMVRYYGPQKPVLDGSFRFPTLQERKPT